MKERMPSIFQNRQPELEQLFIEAHEYESMKVKAPAAVPNNWDEEE